MFRELLLAMVVSMDSLGAGLSYGLRGMKVSLAPRLTISFVSLGTSLLAMAGGHLLEMILNPAWAGHIGAVFLALLGLSILLQGWAKTSPGKEAAYAITEGKKSSSAGLPQQGANRVPAPTLLQFRLPGLGLVVQILRDPLRADLDHSGSIGLDESFLLGLALGLDGFGAGFAAAVAGFSPLVTPLLIGLFQLVFFSLGVAGGSYGKNYDLGKLGTWLPGLILLALALWIG